MDQRDGPSVVTLPLPLLLLSRVNVERLNRLWSGRSRNKEYKPRGVGEALSPSPSVAAAAILMSTHSSTFLEQYSRPCGLRSCETLQSPDKQKKNDNAPNACKVLASLGLPSLATLSNFSCVRDNHFIFVSSLHCTLFFLTPIIVLSMSQSDC